VAGSSANAFTSGELVVALCEHRDVEPLAHRLGHRQRGSTRGEQAERAATGGGDEGRDLVELGVGGGLAARRGEPLGDVQDALALVVERAADVQRAPRRGRTGARGGRC